MQFLPGLLAVVIACESPTEPESVQSITLSPTAVELASGQTQQVVATVRSNRGNVLSGYALNWTTSDAAVVSVSGSGVLRGGTVLTADSQTAQVTASGGGVSATVTVTVLPAPAARVALTTPIARLASYATTTLAAQVLATGGQVLEGRSLRWASSDTTLAVVSSTGDVTARGVTDGTARSVTISAFSDSASGSVQLPIDPAPVHSVTLDVESGSLASGASIAVGHTLRDSVGAVLTGRSLRWSVSNSDVATITATGQLTARYILDADPVPVFVRLSAELVTDSLRITVQPSPVARLVPNITSVGLSVGATYQLTTAVLDARNVQLAGRPIDYATADTTIAVVSSTGLITTRASGTTTVRVRSGDVDASVSLEVIRWVDVGGGNGFTCALTETGIVYCWGGNSNGQLGDGTFTSRAIPVRVNTPLRFTRIAVGTGHTCGITTDAAIACWGRNGFGQLGDSTTVNRSEPVRLPGSRTYASVTTAGSHTCALTSDGDALCWGRNVDGMLGDGTNTNRFVPVAVAGTVRFQSLAARERHTCGLDAAGRAYCWGANSWRSLGAGEYHPFTGEWLVASNVPIPMEVNVRYAAFAEGGEDTGCAIGLAGLAYCWGRNREYQVGNQGVGDVMPLAQVASNERFRTLAIGDSFTCGLSLTDDLWCWGVNLYERLGALPELNNKPELLSDAGKYTAIDTGNDHICGITLAGVLQCRGRGDQGALGDGTFVSRRGTFQPVIVRE